MTIKKITVERFKQWLSEQPYDTLIGAYRFYKWLGGRARAVHSDTCNLPSKFYWEWAKTKWRPFVKEHLRGHYNEFGLYNMSVGDAAGTTEFFYRRRK